MGLSMLCRGHSSRLRAPIPYDGLTGSFPSLPCVCVCCVCVCERERETETETETETERNIGGEEENESDEHSSFQLPSCRLEFLV
jgi:hypothetical protein